MPAFYRMNSRSLDPLSSGIIQDNQVALLRQIWLKPTKKYSQDPEEEECSQPCQNLMPTAVILEYCTTT